MESYTHVQTQPIMGSMKIGEELSLLIYLKDPLGKYDVAARDCWAYDNSDVTDKDTTKLQLTTTDGCIKYLLNLLSLASKRAVPLLDWRIN